MSDTCSTPRQPLPYKHARPPLPVETLYAGDTIAYYSRAFVCVDERGYRVAVIVRIDRTEEEFPVQLDTGEPLPLTNKMKRLQDKFGNTLESEKAKWRSLRSFRLVDGCFNAPTRSSTLAAEIRAAVADSFTAVLGRSHQENQDRRPQRATLVAQQEKVVEDAISSDSSSCVPNTDATLTEPDGDVELDVGWPSQRVVNEPSCSPVIDLTCSPSKVSAKRDGSAGSASEGPRSGEVGEGLPDEHGVDIGTDDDADSMDVVTALAEYEGVPTPHQHRAICHRTKTSRNPWHVTKSRRSQYKAKRRPIKSAGKIYHAYTAKAKKLQRLMNTPKMKKLLAELKERRPIYQAVQPSAPVLPDTATVEWPSDVDYISECINNEGIRFKDAGNLGICRCVGDCFRNECHNAIGEVYCTPANCKLDGNCSNFPREAQSLRLFQTRHAGLGVYTTQRLEAGDIVGEYCGVLHGYEGQRKGQPSVKKKENSGYTMLLNHRASDGKFVYIEPAKQGSYMRFLNHSCSPNAEFAEMQYRTHVRVVVVMLEPADAGAEVTVSYGKSVWFPCYCDKCFRRQLRQQKRE